MHQRLPERKRKLAMSLSLRELLPPGSTKLSDLQLVTHVTDTNVRRQAARVLMDRHHKLVGGLTGKIGLPMADLRPLGDHGFTKSYSGGSIDLADFVNGPQAFQRYRG